ncbi:hypothetical protein [Argonema galeatum]|uniref:hypothetical protein n=1 Tax=Argonema galeatum TaxID=2942762 RepID=UPI002013385F|nr:hypothetical protein [Argonema galeatum]MCL1463089.1 hypothetical protein [Argonema galeatum A003/A1]
MKNLKQAIIECSGPDLEQRKHWYSPAAEAYNQVRPCYPDELIDRVFEVAKLSSNSTILEVGCGPATATTSFAAHAQISIDRHKVQICQRFVG